MTSILSSAVRTVAAIVGAAVIADQVQRESSMQRSANGEGAVAVKQNGPDIVETCHCIPDGGWKGSWRAAARSGVLHSRAREEYANVADVGRQFSHVFVKPGQITWATGEGRCITAGESVVLVHAMPGVQIRPTEEFEPVATYRAIRPIFATRGAAIRDMSPGDLGAILSGTSVAGPARVLVHGGVMQSESIDLLLAMTRLARVGLSPCVESVPSYAGLLRRAVEVDNALVIGLKGLEFPGLTPVRGNGVAAGDALSSHGAAIEYPFCTSVTMVVRRSAASAGYVARRLSRVFAG